MKQFVVPFKNPKPDIDSFIRAMKGEISPEKPPVCEYLIDDILMKKVLVDMLGRPWIEKSDKT